VATANFGQFLDPKTYEPLAADAPRVICSHHPYLREFTLLQPVVFRSPNGHIWKADHGYLYNGASIPRFFWRWARPEEPRIFPASAIHDRLCDPALPVECDSVTAACVFWLMLRAGGTRPVKAFLMWLAVRLFGPQFSGESM